MKIVGDFIFPMLQIDRGFTELHQFINFKKYKNDRSS